jgi:hypothetical protein
MAVIAKLIPHIYVLFSVSDSFLFQTAFNYEERILANVEISLRLPAAGGEDRGPEDSSEAFVN